jgi:hypothetical protein
VIHFYDNGTSFTVEWRNVTLVDQQNLGRFSFQATLKDNGDIIFAYGSIPGNISDISNASHPVKIGISDAYTINHDILCELRLQLVIHFSDVRWLFSLFCPSSKLSFQVTIKAAHQHLD